MGLNELVEKVADPYDRKARLWPALLAILPLIILVMLFYGPKVSALVNVVTLTTSCGGLYLMKSICRERGKRLEPRLNEKWGGKPSTQLLRHRNEMIDGITKRRYHTFLAKTIGQDFPDREQEAADPAAADEIYQSAVRWLLNQTRDTQRFALLFKENVSYGFRRNALGVKPIGLGTSIGVPTFILLSQGVVSPISEPHIDLNALMGLPETAIVSLIVSAILLAVWVFFFTEASVHSASFTYAETLLRACDVL